jgi:hypothetical protein
MYTVSGQGSERATSDSGKIITFNGRTHVSYQDVGREGYFNRVRTFYHDTGTWSDPVTLDIGVDNHARAVLAMAPDGTLHAALGGHASAVRWCHSVAPNDITTWTEPQPVGVGTYPIFMCGPDGTVYLTLRGQGAEREDRGVDLYRRPPGGEWEPPVRVVQLAEEYGQAYAGFHMQMDAAPDGVLHAIIDFYEGEDEVGRGLHQATCYTRSRDGGQRWVRADGTGVRLPARPEDLDILARSTRSRHEHLPQPDIRQGGLVVDSQGRPFAFYMDHGKGPGCCMMVTTGVDGALQQIPVHDHWERLFPDMRATGCKTSRREDDTICVLVTLTPYNEDWKEGKPTRAMSMRERHDERLVWLLSGDGGKTFEVQSFLEPGRGYNVPSVEQPRGANVVPADRLPAVLYFDGSRAYPGGGDYYDESRTVAEILASGGFRTNNVILKGLTPSNPYCDAANWKRAVPPLFRNHPAFTWPPSANNLPRVLLLGDSISISYTIGVRQRLEPIAHVFRAPDNCRSTRQTQEELEIWLGDGNWDVIHLNCGIHDVTRMNADFLAEAEGTPQVPIATYRANIERIFDRLVRTSAQLIWATTTPVGDEVAIRLNEDIDAYNRAVAEIIASRDVRVNDLNTLVRSHGPSLWSDGVHFTDAGAGLLADAVAAAIRPELR